MTPHPTSDVREPLTSRELGLLRVLVAERLGFLSRRQKTNEFAELIDEYLELRDKLERAEKLYAQ